MNLRVLLAVHAALTFAAGAVLVISPGLIPGSVGVRVGPDAYLVCYLLAAAELSIAVLSWRGRALKDSEALRLISWTCIVLHAASGVLEIYAFGRGAGAALWGNAALRAAAVLAFAYYGLYRPPEDTAQAGSEMSPRRFERQAERQ